MNNNEPAFPVSTRRTEGDDFGHQDGESTYQFPGMTLRDYFAGVDLSTSTWGADGPIGRLFEWLWYGKCRTLEEVAEDAYEMADAMLAERDR